MKNDPRQWTEEQLREYRRTFARGDNMLEDARDGKGTVIAYEKNGVFYAVAFRGKAAKSEWHYRFRNADSRAQHIAEFWKNLEACAQYKADRAQKRVADAAKNREAYTVGTILHGSWGYDQTNCELYEITGREGAFAWIRPLCRETVKGSEGFMCEDVRPVPGKYCGEPEKHLVTANGIKLASYCYLTPTTADAKHYSSHYA